MTDYEQIGLRSDKARKIIGEIPPPIIRSGIGTIFIITILLFLAAAFIPYKENVKVGVTFEKTPNSHIIMIAKGLVPYRFINTVKVGAKVQIELEGYSNREYGYALGKISEIFSNIITINGQNYFAIRIKVLNKNAQSGMKGDAFILVSDKTVLQKLF